jgi:hypothetical protein
MDPQRIFTAFLLVAGCWLLVALLPIPNLFLPMGTVRLAYPDFRREKLGKIGQIFILIWPVLDTV